MRGKGKVVRWLSLVLAVLFVCACAFAESGVEYDDEGGVWDWDKGTYTPAGGTAVPIVQDNEPASSSSGSGDTSISVRKNEDGSMTIITDEEDIVRNPDGSMVVESGQISVTDPNADKSDTDRDAAWAQGMGQAAIANGTHTPTWYIDPQTGEEIPVNVNYLGLARSSIVLNGEDVLVDTCNLRWETEAPENKMIAVVSSKTECNLRAKASKKSLSMDGHVSPATVMRVLKTGKNWTFVDYNGLRGYLATSYLTFYANEAREYRTGWVATKSGHTWGNSTVHIRATNKGKQLKPEFPVGTPLTIFADDGKWLEVDVGGYHGVILKTFTLYEDAAASE